MPGLAEALEAGGIHHHVAGSDRESVLRAVVLATNLPASLDRERFYAALVAREALGSTGVGEGIAIPHARHPLELVIDAPVIGLCFLDRAVDFGAIDGKPVDVVFPMVTSTIRDHLHLLSRLAVALHDPGFRAAVLGRASAEQILAHARRIDAGSPS